MHLSSLMKALEPHYPRDLATRGVTLLAFILAHSSRSARPVRLIITYTGNKVKLAPGVVAGTGRGA